MKMDFDKTKKKYMDALFKPDNSKKGNVDEEIVDLINIINEKNDFYTTSSCAGRITLFEIPEDGRKNEGNWLIASHEEVTIEQIKDALKNHKENVVWLRFESCILHICARNLEVADNLLKVAKESSFKRAGIINTTPRIMIEIFGNLKLDTPIAKDGKLLISEDYLKYLVNNANQKMAKNRERIKKLEDNLRKV